MLTEKQTLVQAVLSHGESTPDKMAVALKGDRLTYRDLSIRLRNMAAILEQEFDVKRGDYVLIAAPSKPEYVVAMLAVQFLGAACLPVDKAAKEATVLDVWDMFEPKLILTDTKVDEKRVNKASLKQLYLRACDSEVEAKIEYCLPEPRDIAEILFTTGTTGKPKGAMLSYGSLLASMHNTWQGNGMLESDRILIPLPLNHSLGLRVLRATLYIGATVILQNGFTFAKDLENNIAQYGCTGLVAVPTSMEMLSRQMGDHFPAIIGQLRYIEVGAGSLPIDMRKKLLQILPNTRINNTWGSTETGGALFLNLRENPDKLGSIGRPLEGIEIKVIDQEGNTLQARDMDTAGRMVLRGTMQMSGYYNMPEVNAATLVDGWLYTNDIVYTDEDGFVYMLGRADDIINVGGEKVSPIEVENAAQEADFVKECACIGVEDPDGILGRIPVLYVVPEGQTVSAEQISRYLAGKLERYKLPQRYVFIRQLPRNRMQKIDRKALRKMWEETGDQELVNETVRSLLERRSIRDFTDQPISRAHLEMILQTGVYAPNGHNMQTWRFTVIQDAVKIAELKEVVGRVTKGRKSVHFYGFNNPQAVILVSNDRRNQNGIQDCSCAAENMMIAAHSYGIGSAWVNALVSVCDEPELRNVLDTYEIPRQHIVYAALVMGYPQAEGRLLAKKQDVIRWVE